MAQELARAIVHRTLGRRIRHDGGAAEFALNRADIDDFAVTIKECDRQRQQRIAHPHAMRCVLRKNEEHTVLWRHFGTPHQSDGALFLG